MYTCIFTHIYDADADDADDAAAADDADDDAADDADDFDDADKKMATHLILGQDR